MRRPPDMEVAMTVLDKQSWTARKEWFSSLGVGYEVDNYSPYKISLLQTVSNDPGHERIPWKNNLS
jgi:hypothetical protein